MLTPPAMCGRVNAEAPQAQLSPGSDSGPSTKTKVGYEMPQIRHFYRYVPPRPLAEIDAIKQLEAEIQALLADVTE